MPTRELSIAASAVFALACATQRAGAKPVRHRTRRDTGGDRGLEHRYRSLRQQLAAGKRQRQSRAVRSSISNARPVTATKGEGGVGDRLVGGQGTLATPEPVETVGSYWPYAPTLFDYIRRAMPQNAPQSLSNDDVYAVSAYILNLNGLLPADATLDAKTLMRQSRCRTGTCSSAIRVPTSRTRNA